MGKKIKKPKNIVFQKHHISYDPEIFFYVFKGEHKILTLIQWFCRRKVSKGFIESLKDFISKRESGALDLEKTINESSVET